MGDHLAALRLETIVSISKAEWAIVRLHPSENSGGIVAKGAYIDAATGKLLVDVHARFPVVESGHWEVVMSLTSKTEERGSYEWEVSERDARRVLSAGNLYSPFSGGGTVICRVNRIANGSNESSQVYLIPDEWAESVADAFDYIKQNRQRFDPRSVVANRSELVKLLTTANPFLAIAAFRTLSDSDQLDRGVARDALSHRRGYLQGAVVYIALRTEVEEDAIKEEITTIIAGARTTDESKGIAMALLAGMLDHTGSVERAMRYPELMRKLWDKHVQEHGDGTEPDAYIRAVLEKAGIRESAKPGHER